MDSVLQSMFDCLSRGNPIYLPSKFWEAFNAIHLEQLETDGYSNFKQTIVHHYFTWAMANAKDQIQYLVQHTNVFAWPSILRGSLIYDPSYGSTRKQQLALRLFTKMLWKLAERSDKEGLLKYIEEPLEGRAYRIIMNGKFISQDIANSVLEYYSMREHFTASRDEEVTICELGAGHGRNAYVFAKALPKCKYIIVDIPPALYISQRYLSTVLTDKKIFKFRCFENFSEVEEEFNAADMVFLLPHQAAMLPHKSVDLFLNISSLHEMTREQICSYFALINQLTRGYFYSKQWLETFNPHDQIRLTYNDYPVPDNWRELYLRTAKVQVKFFEAMYAIEPAGAVTGAS